MVWSHSLWRRFGIVVLLSIVPVSFIVVFRAIDFCSVSDILCLLTGLLLVLSLLLCGWETWLLVGVRYASCHLETPT